MFKNLKVQTLLVLTAGALLGYGAANSNRLWNRSAEASTTGSQDSINKKIDAPQGDKAGCCMAGNGKGDLLAMANRAAEDEEKATGKKPNILFIMGDDIGW